MGTNELDQHIADAPVAVHFPGVNGVEISHVNGSRQLKIVHVDAPDFSEFSYRGLNLAFVVRAAGLKHRVCSVPIPVHPESGMRLSSDGILKLRVFPSPAAIGRYFHAPDGAPAGP